MHCRDIFRFPVWQAVRAVWRSKSQRWLAANVVLALDMRGSPRKLGVPGEDSQKVAYRLLEPEPFTGKHVLVVGLEIQNDAVITQIGGTSPADLLKTFGINLVTKYGER